MEHQQSLNTNHEASTIIIYKPWNINICLIQIMKNQYIFNTNHGTSIFANTNYETSIFITGEAS